MCDARALLGCTLTIIIEPTVNYGKLVLWVASHVRKTSLVVKETPAPMLQENASEAGRGLSPRLSFISRPERPLLAGNVKHYC